MLGLRFAFLSLAACGGYYMETIATLPATGGVVGFSGSDVVFATTQTASPIVAVRGNDTLALTEPVRVVGFGADLDGSAIALVAGTAMEDGPLTPMRLGGDGTLTAIGTNPVAAGATTVLEDAAGLRFTAGGATSVLAAGATTWMDGPAQLGFVIRGPDGHVYGRVLGSEVVVRMDAGDVATPVSCADCAGFIGIDHAGSLYYRHDGELEITTAEGAVIATTPVPSGSAFAGVVTAQYSLVLVANGDGDDVDLYTIAGGDFFDVAQSFAVTPNARTIVGRDTAFLIDARSVGTVTAAD